MNLSLTLQSLIHTSFLLERRTFVFMQIVSEEIPFHTLQRGDHSHLPPVF